MIVDIEATPPDGLIQTTQCFIGAEAASARSSAMNTGRGDLFGAKSARADNERVIALCEQIHLGTLL